MVWTIDIGAWEHAAAEIDLTIDRRTLVNRPGSTYMSGTVNGFHLRVWSYVVPDSGPFGESHSTYMDYAVEFVAPIGPTGLSATVQDRVWHWFKQLFEASVHQSRRVGCWALRADDLDQLEAWLTPERVSSFEAMGRGWKVTPREVTLSTKGTRTPIVARCRETLAVAEALSDPATRMTRSPGDFVADS